MSNVLEQALDALETLSNPICVGDEQTAFDNADEAIAALKGAIAQQRSKSALVEFAANGGYDEQDPIERLRFYCSLAMTENDWFDVELFFDAIKNQGAPAALPEFDAGLLNDFGGGNVEWWWDYIRHLLGDAHEHYQEAATIPEGWQLVRTEALDNIFDNWVPTAYEVDLWNELSAAPKGAQP